MKKLNLRQKIVKKCKKFFNKFEDDLLTGLLISLLVGVIFIAESNPVQAEEQVIHVIIEQKFPTACITLWGNICISSIHRDDDRSGGNSIINSGNQIANNVAGNAINNNQMGNNNSIGKQEQENYNPWANKPNPYINHHIPRAGEAPRVGE